ncbi:MAG: hypothetical protein ABI072_10330, partial [Edaphobacter sp.]
MTLRLLPSCASLTLLAALVALAPAQLSAQTPTSLHTAGAARPQAESGSMQSNSIQSSSAAAQPRPTLGVPESVPAMLRPAE